jgi:hypothetical protein
MDGYKLAKILLAFIQNAEIFASCKKLALRVTHSVIAALKSIMKDGYIVFKLQRRARLTGIPG